MSMTRTFSRTLHGPAATHALGRLIGSACVGGERIALEGELGAGKTSFARGIADGMGIDPVVVSSPTFTIIHEHEGGRDGLRFVHVDAYRMGDPDELQALGWQEFLDDARAVIALEWPDRAANAIESPHLLVEMSHVEPDDLGEDARHVTCSFACDRAYLHEALHGRCPSCGAAVGAEGAHVPFCSNRCRMADLDNWFSGRYVVSREIEEDDLADPDLG